MARVTSIQERWPLNNDMWPSAMAQHSAAQIVEACEERLGDEGIQQLLDAVQTHLRGGQ